MLNNYDKDDLSRFLTMHVLYLLRMTEINDDNEILDMWGELSPER